MLNRELLEILCCPKCRGGLDYSPERETLTCLQCGKVYQVRNGIPILLADDERA